MLPIEGPETVWELPSVVECICNLLPLFWTLGKLELVSLFILDGTAHFWDEETDGGP